MDKVKTKLTGMGAIPSESTVGFRVWAPHADAVSVIGSFNNFEVAANPLQLEENGFWYTDVPHAKIGDEYKFHIRNGDLSFDRIDPQAREVTNSIGNGIIADRNYDWEDDHFEIADWNQLVIYELHVGTFHRGDDNSVGTFAELEGKLDYLKWLGINAIQIMPTAEFAGDISWGYNPSHIFAVESAYGGPNALKHLVKTAHAKGIAVILDVVYNHFGPSDLDLWQFDGWSENDKGGVYFYNDDRSSTPWGETRPDYGRGEVRQFIFDNAMMWIEEFHMDGLRYDMTLYMRTIDGCETRTIPEGWSLAQWINREIHARYPKRITIAEDLRSNPAVTQPDFLGGGDFSTQWDEGFVHPIRNVVAQVEDQHRSMQAVCDAVTHRYNNDAFERVVYSESHDEVANGKQRLVSEIDQETPDSFHARKRSMLAAAMVFTSPGIPMIFQGQEFLRSRWFDDTNPIDWEKASENEEVVRFYRQLIRLRTNAEGVSKGLTGQHVDFRHINDVDKVIAFHRWHEHGPGDDCFVVANFSHRRFENYRFGLPSAGNWNLMIDSGSNEFGDDFSSTNPGTIESVAEAPMDGYAHSAKLALSPYSVVILSRSAKQ